MKPIRGCCWKGRVAALHPAVWQYLRSDQDVAATMKAVGTNCESPVTYLQDTEERRKQRQRDETGSGFPWSPGSQLKSCCNSWCHIPSSLDVSSQSARVTAGIDFIAHICFGVLRNSFNSRLSLLSASESAPSVQWPTENTKLCSEFDSLAFFHSANETHIYTATTQDPTLRIFLILNQD